MSQAASNKRGLRSDTLKKQAARHSEGPMPATTPVPGAFGKQVQRVRATRSPARGMPPPAKSERNTRTR
jgi:hypothetical protein